MFLLIELLKYFFTKNTSFSLSAHGAPCISVVDSKRHPRRDLLWCDFYHCLQRRETTMLLVIK
ncbi:hypothetical protein D3C85_1507480 [compost metagenome]